MTALADEHQDRWLTGRVSDTVSAVAMDYPPRQRYEAVTGARSAEFSTIMAPAEMPADGDAVKSTPNASERLRTNVHGLAHLVGRGLSFIGHHCCVHVAAPTGPRT
jgi:hypothetical protein